MLGGWKRVEKTELREGPTIRNKHVENVSPVWTFVWLFADLRWSLVWGGGILEVNQSRLSQFIFFCYNKISGTGLFIGNRGLFRSWF